MNTYMDPLYCDLYCRQNPHGLVGFNTFMRYQDQNGDSTKDTDCVCYFDTGGSLPDLSSYDPPAKDSHVGSGAGPIPSDDCMPHGSDTIGRCYRYPNLVVSGCGWIIVCLAYYLTFIIS